MRRKYIKPDIYYENFELSQHIANCNMGKDDENKNGRYEERTNSTSGETCYYDIGFHLFLDGNTQCEVLFDISNDYEEFCYQSSSAGSTYFSS